jgi:hypothetical protein
MNLARVFFGVGVGVLLVGCAPKPSASRVVYVPMKEWREPEAAKLAHPTPGGFTAPPNPIKLTRHDSLKSAAAKTPSCNKSGAMTACYEEAN